MTKSFSFSIRRAAWLSILILLFGLVGVALTQELSSEPKIWPHADMRWMKDQALPSVQSVLLWGNPQTGEHGMLRKFPAGYAPPPHKHPSAERVVVVSGTIEVRHGGESAKSLGPGSYSEIPADVVHAVKCAEQSDCEFVLASPGPFAIIPVK
jgi:quercetin dioxygenase-like cupin family protein